MLILGGYRCIWAILSESYQNEWCPQKTNSGNLLWYMARFLYLQCEQIICSTSLGSWLLPDLSFISDLANDFCQIRLQKYPIEV